MRHCIGNDHGRASFDRRIQIKNRKCGIVIKHSPGSCGYLSPQNRSARPNEPAGGSRNLPLPLGITTKSLEMAPKGFGKGWSPLVHEEKSEFDPALAFVKWMTHWLQLGMRRSSPLKKHGTLFTPLGIVAAFVSLTETVLGIALTRVGGVVQIALTGFVIAFPLLVAAAFFYILWNRAYVFYAPSEYGNVNPSDFMSAMRDAPVVINQVELAKSVEQNPLDEEARFSLIDSMADDAEVQCVIFMYESGKDLSTFSFYVYVYKSGAFGTGAIGGRDRLQGAGIVRRPGNGRFLSLTDEGKLFATWLIKRGRKCDYFRTEAGGWGTPEPGGREDKWIRDAQEQAKNWRIAASGRAAPATGAGG